MPLRPGLAMPVLPRICCNALKTLPLKGKWGEVDREGLGVLFELDDTAQYRFHLPVLAFARRSSASGIRVRCSVCTPLPPTAACSEELQFLSAQALKGTRVTGPTLECTATLPAG